MYEQDTSLRMMGFAKKNSSMDDMFWTATHMDD